MTLDWWEIEPCSLDAAAFSTENFSSKAISDVVERLKPGANVVLTGTFDHATAAASACLEDAGLEIRDCITILNPDGLGTVLLARNPLDGTVAANVLKHSTGALNIDACRIGIADGDEPSAGHRTATFGTQETISGGNGSGGWQPPGTGRWPANLFLTHTENCQPTGVSTEVTGGGAAGTSGFADGYKKGDGYAGRELQISEWDCAENCPARVMDDQSGVRAAGAAPKTNNVGFGGVYTEGTQREGVQRAERVNYGSGGASRFFHAATNHSEYLIRLIVPPEGTLLDLTGTLETQYCRVIRVNR